MPKEKSQPLKYDEIVERLESVVAQLESGKLSLEDSLDTFAEGVKLVESGEELLKSAERRIEVLLSKDGQTAPFEETAPAPPRGSPRAGKKEPPPALSEDEEDVPF